MALKGYPQFSPTICSPGQLPTEPTNHPQDPTITQNSPADFATCDTCGPYLSVPVFATGQSVQSFPELARQVRAKDQDGQHCVIPLVPHRPPPSSVVLRRPPSSPPSSVIFRCFLLFSAVFRRAPPSPSVLHHPRL